MGKGLDVDLVVEMQKPRTYGSEETSHVELIETHISWVFLTTKYAYKIKKPTRTAFLDYSTLELRKEFCEREVELDRRYATSLYLGVVPITQQADELRIDGVGTVVEYAVKMMRFPTDSLLSELLLQDRVGHQEIKLLATLIADFHANARRAAPDAAYGAPEAIFQDAIDNLDALAASPYNSAEESQMVAALRHWTVDQFTRRQREFARRKQDGFVRECHGDLHAGNVVFWKGRLIPFDGIEFSEHFRWIDSLSDLAFLAMDLQVRDQRPLSNLMVNSYLEASGDYRSLALLNWYIVYRALVRAKVADLVLAQHQPNSGTYSKAAKEKTQLIAHAYQAMQAEKPTLWITHGLSGSGKSTSAERKVLDRGAIRIRSDVERKRIAELGPTNRPSEHLAKQIYASSMTDRVYKRLLELAGSVIEAGYSVVIDATFLKQSQRSQFAKLSDTMHVDFRILHCEARLEALQERIIARQQLGADPSDADLNVLQSQLANQEPLTTAELLRVEPLYEVDSS